MKTLAIDLSTETGSLAWCEQGRVRLEREWPPATSRRRPVFTDLLALVQARELALSSVDRYAVGVGPGAFSGLRMAVALVQALALPDGKPVTAVSSARALAHSLMGETGADRAVVFGDARRDELWAGCFSRVDGLVCQEGDWIVAPAGQVAEPMTRPGTVWVSADWERIGALLAKQCPPGVTLVRETRVPRATMVAALVEDLVAREAGGEPPVPVYVHPAVSIAPRYL